MTPKFMTFEEWCEQNEDLIDNLPDDCQRYEPCLADGSDCGCARRLYETSAAEERRKWDQFFGTNTKPTHPDDEAGELSDCA